MPSLIAKTNNGAHEERDCETKIAKAHKKPAKLGLSVNCSKMKAIGFAGRRLLKPSSLDQAINSKLPKRAGCIHQTSPVGEPVSPSVQCERDHTIKFQQITPTQKRFTTHGHFRTNISTVS